MSDFIITADGGSKDSGFVGIVGYGSFIVEIPAGSRGSESKAMRSSQIRCSFGPEVTNNEAEYRIIIEALIYLAGIIDASGDDTQIVPITVRTDSALVIGQMTQGWKRKAENLHKYQDQLGQLIHRFNQVTFEKLPGDEIKKILGH